MAAISKRTFLFTDKNLLLLANEEWVRLLPNGGNWARIRIGFLAAVSSNSTSNILDCPCFFGLCAGNTAPSSAFNTRNFVGVSAIGAATTPTARLLTYNAVTQPYYSTTTGQIFRRFDQTNVATNFGSASAVFVPAAVGPQRRRCPFVVDISRQSGGGGLYTFNVYSPSSATAAFDYRPDHLLDMVDQLGTPVSYGQTMTVLSSAQTLNAGDELGCLDSICLYWGRQAYPLEVYAIAASVITDTPWPQTPVGGALETFDTYSVGSVAPAAGTLNQGIGWSGTFTSYGSSNPNFQLGISGTSSGFPGEDFEAYSVGSIATFSTINQGTGWSGTFTYFGSALGTNQFGLAGTSTGNFDSFETYGLGTVLTAQLNAGVGWPGPYTLTGTYPNPSPQVGYAGTSMGTPYDAAGSYALTSGSVLTLNLGLGWASNGTTTTFTGTSYYNLTPQNGYSGTSCTFPLDTFDTYAVGAVTSGVTINAGTNWASYGTIA